MTKLPPYHKGSHVVGHCLNCPPKPTRLDLRRNYNPGFGTYYVTRDGKMFRSDGTGHTPFRMYEVEKIASEFPESDWRMIIDGPMTKWTYQRHGKKNWVLVGKDIGFA